MRTLVWILAPSWHMGVVLPVSNFSTVEAEDVWDQRKNPWDSGTSLFSRNTEFQAQWGISVYQKNIRWRVKSTSGLHIMDPQVRRIPTCTSAWMHTLHTHKHTHLKKYIPADTLILWTIWLPDRKFMLARPITPALKSLSEEDYQDFEIILGYIVCFGPVWAIELDPSQKLK